MLCRIMNADLAAQKALDRMAKDGVDALSERDRTVAAVWLFAAGVGNGGFAGYFAGWRADLAGHTPAALRAIGARQMADLAVEANAVFGAEGPPRDHKARREAVRKLPEAARRAFAAMDKRYFGCEEDIDQLLEDFVGRGGP